MVVEPARDERTPGLDDDVWKSLVYFGPDLDIAQSRLLYARLFSVGDVNGDGYDDALSGEGVYYEGSPAGL